MDVNILVVDNEKEIADLVELYLVSENYKVHKFYTAQEAIQCVNTQKLDLAIFDVMLPDMDGFTICQKIREKYNFPIILLTAMEKENDKITGLTLGADDYITKPFHPLEMVARVKAHLRRFIKYNSQEPDNEQTRSTLSGLVLNKETHESTLNEFPLKLTPIEFSILWTLCEKRGQVISGDKIFQEVWGDKYFCKNSNTVMVHIRHLREKLGDARENPKYIKTVWGRGYKIE